jgi:hypothetical protein
LPFSDSAKIPCLNRIVKSRFQHIESTHILAADSDSPRIALTFAPQPLSDFERIDLHLLPPRDFVSPQMQTAMVDPAERDGEFITHLAHVVA